MSVISIDFVGRKNDIHTVSIIGGDSSRNDPLADLFYENLDSLLQTLCEGLDGASVDNYYFNDFVVIVIEAKYARISYSDDSLLSPVAYAVKLVDLVDALEKWRTFKSQDRNGIVQTVMLEGEVIGQ